MGETRVLPELVDEARGRGLAARDRRRRAKFNGSPFAPGLERRTELPDGDLVVEVAITVRRRVTLDDAGRMRAAALAWAAAELWRVRRCNVSTRPKGWLKYGGRCEGRVVAAVAYRGYMTGDQRFSFVCGRHREHHGIAPAEVLGVIELPTRQLDELRKAADAEEAAARQKDREREEREREAPPRVFCSRPVDDAGRCNDDDCRVHGAPAENR